MPISVSPTITNDHFPNWPNLTLDDKIRIFVDRVNGWQLDVAYSMAQQQYPFRWVALLFILVSYFEMIGKYSCYPKTRNKNGKLVGKDSAKFFESGFRTVFPDLKRGRKEITQRFWIRVRNGLYHAGNIQTGVIADFRFPEPLGWESRYKLIGINPDLLAGKLRQHFKEYSDRLRNPRELTLRRRFEARYDLDNRDY
jgi:hypothetical protein